MDPIDDQLRIDTPEQIALELPLAGVGSRFLAITVDTLLQLLILVAGSLTFAVAGTRLLGWLVGTWVVPVALIFLVFLLLWGYYALFESFWNGQTPGKRTARIRVIKESGRPITWVEAVIRNLLRVVDFLPTMYAAGVVCMLLDKRNRRLGDIVAGTVVVHEQRQEDFRRYVEVASTPAPEIAADTARLAREDLVLIETYLERRHDLDPEVRMRMRDEIAARIRAKMQVRDEPARAADEFLEAVARQIRRNGRF